MKFILSDASERQTSTKTNNCHLDLTMKNVWKNYIVWDGVQGQDQGSQMTVDRVQINAVACEFHNVSINSATIKTQC